MAIKKIEIFPLDANNRIYEIGQSWQSGPAVTNIKKSNRDGTVFVYFDDNTMLSLGGNHCVIFEDITT